MSVPVPLVTFSPGMTERICLVLVRSVPGEAMFKSGSTRASAITWLVRNGYAEKVGTDGEGFRLTKAGEVLAEMMRGL